MTTLTPAGDDEQKPRRSRRGRKPVDINEFQNHIDDALTAFATDVTYAVLMARSAVTITRKRQVWQTRREQRQAA